MAQEANSRYDQLAWLILRVLAELSPCKKESLVARISGDASLISESSAEAVVLSTLQKLQELEYVQDTQGLLMITGEGRQHLDAPPREALRPWASRHESLRTLVAGLSAECPAWLKRYWHICINRAGALAQRLEKHGRRGSIATIGIWKRKVTPNVVATVSRVAHATKRLATKSRKRAKTSALTLNDRLRRTGIMLSNALETANLSAKLGLADRSGSVMISGALLFMSLSTVASITFLSGKSVETLQSAPATSLIAAPKRSSVEEDATVSPSSEPVRPDPSAEETRTEIIRAAVRSRLSKHRSAGSWQKRAHTALLEYYSKPANPLIWVHADGLTGGAKSVMKEISKADDYGLRATDYDLPDVADDVGRAHGTGVNRLADAEVKLSLAVLHYARDARGARIAPSRLTANLNPTIALPDASEVLSSISVQAEPATYLRDFHPSQPQFEALRRKLLELRGTAAANEKPRLKIPPGPLLRAGVQHPQVALLRKRLELPSGQDPTNFDQAVQQAVKAFQKEQNAALDGVVGPATRELLNAPHLRVQSRIKTIILNMERWRWLPPEREPFYVSVNLPEFMLRVIDEGETIHTARVVVGRPRTQTPVFSDEMKTVVFGPYWNVPNSIKMEEIRPYLRQELWLLGGWDTSILRRHNLHVKHAGREIDPGALDWDRVDIRSLHIYQPPGPGNVLGRVKFMFPNKHDVYLHDTPQKHLFSNQVRAESHGCIRVQNPDELASLILERDQGWDRARTISALENGFDKRVQLSRKVPVHITYFTMRVNDDGSISTFRDLYGHDARMAAALFGSDAGFDYPDVVEGRTGTLEAGNNQAPWADVVNSDLLGGIVRLLEN